MTEIPLRGAAGSITYRKKLIREMSGKSLERVAKLFDDVKLYPEKR